MNRRQLLLSSLGYLTGIAALRKTGYFPAVLITYPHEYTAIDRVLSRLFTIPEDARAIGIRYLKHYPERTGRSQLLDVLGPDIAALETMNNHTLLNHLNSLRRQDFIDGETVIVDNWILSRTEASLCALLTLS